MMMKIRQILGMLVMVAGILSVNAMPYVPHHHHDGKICLEETHADECGDESGLEDVHSIDNEYDMPRSEAAPQCVVPMIVLLACIGDLNLIYLDTCQQVGQPEKAELFCWDRYAARTQVMRGSPCFSVIY